MYANLFALEAMGNVLRAALWMTLAGLVAAGACYGAGYGAYTTWATKGPPARRHRRAEAALIREASRGITEIETFLATRSAPRGPAHPPPSAGDA